MTASCRPAMFALLLLALIAFSVSGAELFVSAGGNDAGAGTRSQPLATLEAARDRIRSMKKAGALPVGGVTVWIEGAIARDKGFVLGAEDSGTPEAPIVYRGVTGTSALVAGRILKSSDFAPATDPKVVARLDESARGKLVRVDLAKLGIQHAGPFKEVFGDGGGLIRLFVNDKPMPISRWPNEGYAAMAKVVDKGDWGRGAGRHGGAFLYREDRPARWNVECGVWLDGFWRVPWTPETVKVQAIDTAKKQITFAQPVNGGIGSKYAGDTGSGKEPWCAINLLEEIDRPGEWCIDFAGKMLYFWPPEAVEKSRVMIADLAEPVVLLDGVSHITVSNLVIEGGWGQGVEIRGGDHNTVAGCTFARIGRYGALIKGGHDHTVRSCDFFDLGFGGVMVGGGQRKTLTPANHAVVNCHIYRFGQSKKTYAPGIALGISENGEGVGCRLAHNLIHDAPHAAVLYGGNEHLIEFNEVHDVALDSGDVGAFYTTNDWTSRGNVLRHNFVYDCPKANAFYMDDGDSGDAIFGNVVLRCIYGPFIGGGHDNLVQNNLVVACERAIHLDQRGISRGYNASNKGMVSTLNAMNYKQPPFSTKYSTLPGILENHPDFPTGNVIENNAMIGCKTGLHLGGKKEELRFSTIGKNAEFPLERAGLSDIAKLDLRLQPTSAVYSKLPTFKPIPFERIGLQIDEYRKTIPVRQASRNAAGERFDSNTDVRRSNERR